MTLTPELISSVAGILLSLAFSYLPGLNAWFESQTTNIKRLVMGAALIVVTLGAVGLSCAGWFSPVVTCDKAGAETAIYSLILALVANQSAYLITKG